MGNTEAMSGTTGGDTVGDAVDALYAGAPDDFIAARDALAKAAAPADRAAIKALRRPTVAGWLVNQLVRHESDTVEELLDLGGRLRAAQAAGQGEELRTLAAERRRLTDTLLVAARRLAADARGGTITADLQASVAGSLDAAVADAGLAAQLRSGRLTDALSYAGFGALGLMSVPAGADAPDRPATVRAGSRAAGPAKRSSEPVPTDDSGDAPPARSGGPTRVPAAASAATARERAAERRAVEVAERRRQDAEAAAASARDERRAAEERLRLAEHALSDARMNLDLARRAEKAAAATLEKVKRHR